MTGEVPLLQWLLMALLGLAISRSFELTRRRSHRRISLATGAGAPPHSGMAAWVAGRLRGDIMAPPTPLSMSP